MNKEIGYTSKYLSKEIVDDCFEDGTYHFVNKLLTGNGFTSGYLKLKPTYKHQSNIIIVPNREVLKSKKEAYDMSLNNATKIGFFYGDESSDRLEFGKFDVMMFVVDSFLNYIDGIKKNIDCIDKILIDEAHSILIQSSFRKRLIGFTELIRKEFESKAIVSVTATPMLFTKVDIKLVKENIEQRTIYISQHQENSLKRLQDSLLNGNKVVLALQDSRILKKLSDSNNKLTANIKAGVTLFQKIVETVDLTFCEDSNLTIISSAGFEGFDVENGINDIFIFEDRAFDYQTFYSQNIVQIIGRSREGTARIEWCRMSNSSRKGMLSKKEMIVKAASKRVSFEKKMTDKNYKFIPKYFDYNQDVNFGLITKLTLNDVKYELDKELNDSDLMGLRIYKKFFSDRGFTLEHLNDGCKRMNLKNSSHTVSFKTAKLNEDVIKRFKLYSDVNVNLYAKESHKEYVKAFEVFLRRKYWYAESLLWKMSIEELYEFNTHCLETHLNEMQAYRIILDEDGVDIFLKGFLKESIERKKIELSRNSKEFKQWKSDIVNNLKDRYVRLIMAVSQDKIKLPNKVRNSRDYNLTTEVSMSLIKLVSDAFDKDTVEIDIVSCNPRIIYAFCGLELPGGFYGENKKNKKAINTILNKLSIDFPKEFNVSVAGYKKERKRELKELGFENVVIDFLFKEFWEREKDALFNFCSFHEKNIIEVLQKQFKDKNNDGNYLRRHDSIISFSKLNNSQIEAVNEFEYLQQDGWFKEVLGVEVPEMVEYEFNLDDF